ncbi:hypothetical protein V8C43DRAFT_285213 [Trichoderma afarasin]
MGTSTLCISAKDHLCQKRNHDILALRRLRGSPRYILVVASRIAQTKVWHISSVPSGFLINDLEQPVPDPLSSIRYPCVRCVYHIWEAGR